MKIELEIPVQEKVCKTCGAQPKQVEPGSSGHIWFECGRWVSFTSGGHTTQCPKSKEAMGLASTRLVKAEKLKKIMVEIAGDDKEAFKGSFRNLPEDLEGLICLRKNQSRGEER